MATFVGRNKDHHDEARAGRPDGEILCSVPDEPRHSVI